jgi:hypothetical protein
MSAYDDGHCFDGVCICCDEERIEAIEAENAQLRRELDALWNYLYEVFEGRNASSAN